MSAWKCYKSKMPGGHSGRLCGFAVAGFNATRFFIHGGAPDAASAPSKALYQLDNRLHTSFRRTHDHTHKHVHTRTVC